MNFFYFKEVQNLSSHFQSFDSAYKDFTGAIEIKNIALLNNS